MSANMAVVEQPEETTSLVARNRIVCFVNDELSAAALRKGLDGSNLVIRRGTIRHATRMLETDTDLYALVTDISGIDDPFTELERLASVCPPRCEGGPDWRQQGDRLLPRADGDRPYRIPADADHQGYGARPAASQADRRRRAGPE
ncbi:hypothetical protein [Bradyrhizobium elkanii]|uniref:hypothetical protein n=1 Tax=Bradyrhizobium elkanii TaxID=29448 RepID=UPI003513ED6B